MRHVLLLFAVAWAVAAVQAAPVPKELRTNDNARILGKWKQEGLSMRGAAAQLEASNTVFRFGADGTCGIVNGLGNQEKPAEYTLDQTGFPRRMKWLNGAEKTEWRCYYELDGDSLKVCFIDQNAPLPAKLEPGQTATIYYMKRVKD